MSVLSDVHSCLESYFVSKNVDFLEEGNCFIFSKMPNLEYFFSRKIAISSFMGFMYGGIHISLGQRRERGSQNDYE